MHEHAESGVAAHWAYKEAGAKGYAGVTAAGDFEERIAEARRTVLRQLLAWERELVGREQAGAAKRGLFDDRIYVFTPQGAIVELPAGATPIDFAYTLHTDLGHRCRGARVDGAMVPLNTPLQSGQTVEVTAAEGGRPVARLAQRRTRLHQRARAPGPRCARGSTRWRSSRPSRAAAMWSRSCCSAKARPRSSSTTWPRSSVFATADALFEVVGKDEFSLRNIEQLLRPAEPVPDADERLRSACNARERGAIERQGRRAGGRRRVVADHAGALLQAGAAGCNRRLCHARQGRRGPPRRLLDLPPDGRSRSPSG